MPLSFWLKNWSSPVIDSNGNPILCEQCPCVDCDAVIEQKIQMCRNFAGTEDGMLIIADLTQKGIDYSPWRLPYRSQIQGEIYFGFNPADKQITYLNAYRFIWAEPSNVVSDGDSVTYSVNIKALDCDCNEVVLETVASDSYGWNLWYLVDRTSNSVQGAVHYVSFTSYSGYDSCDCSYNAEYVRTVSGTLAYDNAWYALDSYTNNSNEDVILIAVPQGNYGLRRYFDAAGLFNRYITVRETAPSQSSTAMTYGQYCEVGQTLSVFGKLGSSSTESSSVSFDLYKISFSCQSADADADNA